MNKNFTSVFIFILIYTTTSFSQNAYILADAMTSGSRNGVTIDVKFLELNNIFYYQCNDSLHGSELWRTDGTVAGTYIVKDCNPGTAGGNISFYGVVNNLILFQTFTNLEGIELWVSDGTTIGTYILKDIKPGTGSGLSFLAAFDFIIDNNRLYFSATDSIRKEIWESDGTIAGTKKVITHYPIYIALGFHKVNNKIIVSSSLFPPTQYKIFVLNDSAGVTTLSDLSDSIPDLYLTTGINERFRHNNYLYFSAYHQDAQSFTLYKTDGTQQGTSRIATFNNYGENFGDKGFIDATHVYIMASTDSTGMELFALDLQNDSVSLIVDANPGFYDGVSFVSPSYHSSSNKLFYIADNGVTGGELWVSSGTTNGTFLLKDIYPTHITSTGISMFYEYNNRIIFNADDLFHGEELWSTDGTVLGTQMLRDFNPVGDGRSPVPFLFEGNNYFFLNAIDDEVLTSHIYTDLFITDGTPSGTIPMEICPGITCSSTPTYIGYDGQYHYLWLNEGIHGHELWRCDGDTLSLNLFADLSPGAGSSQSLGGFVDRGIYFTHNNDFYFEADTGQTSLDGAIWKVDQTSGTVTKVSDFGGNNIQLGKFHFLNNRYVIFAVNSNTYGTELWAFDLPGVGTNVKPIMTDQIKLYPNPANDAINVDLQNFYSGKYYITDLPGKTIVSSDFANNRININVENFPAGIYFLNINTGNQVYVKKFIVE